MHITELHLQNFRNFPHLEWKDIHPRLNVLVGVNGSGKTAVLEAVRCLMGEYLYEFWVGGYWQIADDQVRWQYTNRGFEPTNDCKIESKLAFVDGTQFEPYRHRPSFGQETRPQSDTPLRTKGKADRDSLSNSSNTTKLPILAYYSTQRLNVEKSKSKKLEAAVENGSRMTGYFNSLGESSNYELTIRLISSGLITETQLSPEQNAIVNYPVIPIATRCINEILPNTEKLYFERKFNDIVVFQNNGEPLPVRLLSDGYRNLVKLLLDLSCRAAYLNPQLGEKANEAPGLVLIDEIDLHLHPGLQRKAIPLLQELFPNVQFIITTHSPQVVASVPNESVWLLKDNKIERNEHLTYGSDTNSILTELYDVSEYPDKTIEKLENYYRILRSDEWDSPKAKALRSELENLFGLNSTMFYEADDLIALKRFEK